MSRTFRNISPNYFRHVKTHNYIKTEISATEQMEDEVGVISNNRLKSKKSKVPTYFDDIKVSSAYEKHSVKTSAKVRSRDSIRNNPIANID